MTSLMGWNLWDMRVEKREEVDTLCGAPVHQGPSPKKSEPGSAANRD
jgi:hypothetical protein